MKNKKNKKKLFTLIELIIVIVVIGILAAMALPKFMGVQRNAKVGAMQRDLDVIEKAVSQYVTNTSDGSYPFKDLNGDSLINEEDLYFKTSAAPKTLIDSLLKSNGDDGSKIYQLDMDKLKPYIEKIKYPNTEYVYSPESDTAIDPIGKPDGNDDMHHIIGGGSIENQVTKSIKIKEFNTNILNTYVISIAENGNVYAWGDNSEGQLGIGNYDNQYTPQKVQLPEGIKIKSLSLGTYNSLAIGSDGNLYGWGDNYFGQLGLGSISNQDIPTKISLPNGIKPIKVFAEKSYTFVLGDDGNLYATGSNSYGRLGTGDSLYTSIKNFKKVQLPTGFKIKKIYSFEYHTFALSEDGLAYSWGQNTFGKLGIGNDIDSNVPKKINMPNDIKIKELYPVYGHTMAIGQDNNAYSWGTASALGRDTYYSSHSPEKIDFPNSNPIESIKTEYAFGLAKQTNGDLYVWGKNYQGQLGIGEDVDKPTPTKLTLPNGITFKEISHNNSYTVTILGNDSNVYTWGYNEYGQAGLGTILDTYSPIKIDFPEGSKPKSISTQSYCSIVYMENGDVYATGRNDYGQLGIGNKETQYHYTKIELPNNIKPVNVKMFPTYESGYSIILGEDGNLYSSGTNRSGILGLGDINEQLTFKKIEIEIE